MDLRKLKTLIDLVAESGISELEVNEGEDRVRIVNAGSPAPVGQMVYTNPAPIQTMQAAPVAGAPAATALAAEAPAAETGSIARSPMVGTFYRAPNPESPNFVNIGDTVKVLSFLRHQTPGPSLLSAHDGLPCAVDAQLF